MADGTMLTGSPPAGDPSCKGTWLLGEQGGGEKVELGGEEEEREDDTLAVNDTCHEVHAPVCLPARFPQAGDEQEGGTDGNATGTEAESKKRRKHDTYDHMDDFIDDTGARAGLRCGDGACWASAVPHALVREGQEAGGNGGSACLLRPHPGHPPRHRVHRACGRKRPPQDQVPWFLHHKGARRGVARGPVAGTRGARGFGSFFAGTRCAWNGLWATSRASGRPPRPCSHRKPCLPLSQAAGRD